MGWWEGWWEGEVGGVRHPGHHTLGPGVVARVKPDGTQIIKSFPQQTAFTRAVRCSVAAGWQAMGTRARPTKRCAAHGWYGIPQQYGMLYGSALV